MIKISDRFYIDADSKNYVLTVQDLKSYIKSFREYLESLNLNI